MNRNRVLFAALFMLLLLISVPAAAAPLRIGVLVPQTGDMAPFGEKALAGVRVALSEFDPAAVTLVIEDAGSKAGPQVMSAATKLTEVDKVALVLGLFYLDQTLVVAPITERAGIPLFSLTLCSPELKRFKQVACGYPDTDEQLAVLPRVLKTLSAKRLALISDATQYAAESAAVTAKHAAASGAELVAREEYAGDTRDFRSLLTKVLARKPDTIFAVSTDPGQSFALFSQLKQLGFKGNRIGYLDIDQKYIDEFGETISGVLLPGFIGNHFSERFVSESRAVLGRAPDMYQAQAYDIARTVIGAALADPRPDGLYGRVLAYRAPVPAIADFHYRQDGTISIPVSVLQVSPRGYLDWDPPPVH